MYHMYTVLVVCDGLGDPDLAQLVFFFFVVVVVVVVVVVAATAFSISVCFPLTF